jgi:DNA-binding PadR family transcriptional regulator
METESASRAILANLHAGFGSKGASLAQIKMWLVPQKAEHESSYDINKGYFELLMKYALRDLLREGYVQSTLPGGVEDGDAQLFSLTEKGAERVEELAAQAEQAALDY